MLLPEDVKEYKPKGKSPLASVESFIKTTCPKCGGAAERDPDTMDTFVCLLWTICDILTRGLRLRHSIRNT